jgi:hypothetical protein
MAGRGGSSNRLALALVGALVALGTLGCTRTFRGAVAQPNPLAAPTETLRDSEKVVIVTGDMELNVPKEGGRAQRVSPLNYRRYPLQNSASFTLVSRDRLRFHVQLEHKWRDWANPGSWDVYLVDDRGRRWVPESIEHARTRHMVTMWDQEIRSVQRNLYGDIVAINEDGWKRRVPLGSLSVFRGRADFVFYQRDIFDEELRWMKLVVRRPGVGFEFVWNFQDSSDPRRHDEVSDAAQDD